LDNLKNKKQWRLRMSFKVFAFMINPHEMLVVAEDGKKLNQINVDSQEEAKQILLGEAVNQGLIDKLGTTDFSTIWTDDPAGEPEVVEACRLMEERRDDGETEGSADQEVLALNEETGDVKIAGPVISEPNDAGVVAVHTLGLLFQIVSDKSPDGFEEVIDINELAIDTLCRFTAEGQEPSALYRVVAPPINTGAEDSGDFIVQLRAEPEAEVGEEVGSVAVPQFPPSGKTKIIEVECAVTFSEAELRRKIRDVQDLEIAARNVAAQASADAADYKERIKTAKQALYEASAGKAYTSMECNIINDWEGRVRLYIRPDNGEVARREQISMEECQLNMNKALDDATPKPDAEPVAEPQTVEGLTKELGEICDEVDAMIPRDENGDVVDSEADLDDTVTTEDATEHAPEDFPALDDGSGSHGTYDAAGVDRDDGHIIVDGKEIPVVVDDNEPF
jgi:hypothetical protein